ncbi:neuronal acetylcholine receptor subunit beta-3-like isoform X2 [Lineus longissimus]|uniref:neuronal acetylcholine receptor subunit beta-3-like isoform X2 n=1 Tax=Lineus longissimus TaxID=88925 RepID=UPI00315CBEBF
MCFLFKKKMASGVYCVSFAFGVFFFVTSPSYGAGSLNTEGKLLRELTDPSVYERAVRPVHNVSDAVVVSVRLSLENFQLDSSTETLEFFAYVWLGWTDELLRWNESKYDGLISMLVPVDKIWLPDMSIFNRIDPEQLFETQPSAKAILSSNGKIDWIPGGVFSVKCRMKMTKFPFDEQELFCLPCQSGEKISLCTTTLVALTVFQMTTSDIIPKTTNETPIIVIYLTALTAMSAVSTILTVFVLKVFYTPVDRDMSPMLVTIVRGLAKITCNTDITQQKSLPSGSGSSGSQLHNSRTEESQNDLTNGKKPLHDFATDHDGLLREKTRLTWPIVARIIDTFLMLVFVISMFTITSTSLALICS